MVTPEHPLGRPKKVPSTDTLGQTVQAREEGRAHFSLPLICPRHPIPWDLASLWQGVVKEANDCGWLLPGRRRSPPCPGPS